MPGAGSRAARRAVTALCPGFTYTEFHDVNGMRATGIEAAEMAVAG